MDEIRQDPKLNFRWPSGRWFDVAVAVVLIAVATIMVVTRGSSRLAAPAAGSPSVPPAPAPLSATVLARLPLPVSQPGSMTLLGSTAWISDWSTGEVVGVDLATRRITRMLHLGSQQNGLVSMASGAGSLWVLDISGPLLRIDAATGAISKRFPVRGQAADVAYGDGFVWVITDGPFRNGAEEQLYKIDPSRNVIAKVAPIPGAGPGCAVSPGSQGIWVGCAVGDDITLINQASLKPMESVRVDGGGYTPQIAAGQNAVWVLTPAGLARVDPATARITATVRTGYDPDAMSVPALTMDPAGRVWVAGSLLGVMLPGTLAVYPVAQTADTTSVTADGQHVWVDTGTTLVGLQVDTPLCDRCCCQ